MEVLASQLSEYPNVHITTTDVHHAELEEPYDVLIVAMPSPAWPPLTSHAHALLDRLGEDFLQRVHVGITEDYMGELNVGEGVMVEVKDWVYSQLYQRILLVSVARSPHALYPAAFYSNSNPE